jgi:hypothetical protein
MAALSHEAWRVRWLPELDPGIAPYVDALRAEGVETFESCEGGDGHAYPEPTVRFAGCEDDRGPPFLRACSYVSSRRSGLAPGPPL